VIVLAIASGLFFGPAANAGPATDAAAEAGNVTPRAEERPGYGVVESIVALPADPSASAGAGGPAKGRSPRRYLVRVRMDDGSIQVRSVDRLEVRKGERALITNAGDILPE